MASEAARVPEPSPDPGKEGRADEDAIEGLQKEIERLKTRLEEERKKLNDVTCEKEFVFLISCHLSRSRVPHVLFLLS